MPPRKLLTKSPLVTCTFVMVCTVACANAEESSPAKAPVVDPSKLAVDSIACADTMEYPESALRRGASGVSAVEVEVAPDGHLTPLEIVRKSGTTREHTKLDHAAFLHLAACRLPPPPMGETVRTVLFYTWKLE